MKYMLTDIWPVFDTGFYHFTILSWRDWKTIIDYVTAAVV